MEFTKCFETSAPLNIQVENWRRLLRSTCNEAFPKIRIKKRNNIPVKKEISELIKKRNKMMIKPDNSETTKELDSVKLQISNLEAETHIEG